MNRKNTPVAPAPPVPVRIPWTAVGEKVAAADLQAVIRFLLPPAAGLPPQRYEQRMTELGKALTGLAAVAGSAGNLTLGENVRELEAECRRRFKVKHACFLTNATAGFEIAHQLIGLKPDDEVIVPALTFISTMAYPLTVGAKIVIADVDPRTLNLDPADVARKITPRTRAIVPVHLGGYPVDMAPIMQLARRHGVYVIEDAAHAFGGSYRGRRLGTIGHFGAFSFHQVKNVTSFGEGGLLVSNLAVARQFPQCRFLGIDRARHAAGWIYDVVGTRTAAGTYVQPGNHSSTELQAIGLRCQLGRFPKILAQRRAAAAYLTRRFARIPGLLPQLLDTATSQGTYMLYQIQVDPAVLGADIQALKRKLTERGIQQVPNYVPLYEYRILRQLGYDRDALAASCPVAETAYRHRFTHLPIAGLNRATLKILADAVIESAGELKAGR